MVARRGGARLGGTVTMAQTRRGVLSSWAGLGEEEEGCGLDAVMMCSTISCLGSRCSVKGLGVAVRWRRGSQSRVRWATGLQLGAARSLRRVKGRDGRLEGGVNSPF
jgi:hypothetical protein